MSLAGLISTPCSRYKRCKLTMTNVSPTTWPVQDWLTATQSVGHSVACIPNDNEHFLSVAPVTPVTCQYVPPPPPPPPSCPSHAPPAPPLPSDVSKDSSQLAGGVLRPVKWYDHLKVKGQRSVNTTPLVLITAPDSVHLTYPSCSHGFPDQSVSNIGDSLCQTSGSVSFRHLWQLVSDTDVC